MFSALVPAADENEISPVQVSQDKKRIITEPDDESCKKQKVDSSDRRKKKKVAMLMGYLGKNYYGMQRNPGMKTIEEDLIHAMLKANLINDEAFETIQTIQFQRAARTDKGVSAARQVVSLKLRKMKTNVHCNSNQIVSIIKKSYESETFRSISQYITVGDCLSTEDASKDDINNHLPEEIRVFGIKRVTKGFNSKGKCDARTYMYTLPTFAFAHDSTTTSLSKNELDIDQKIEELSTIDGQPFFNYRISPDTIERVNTVLKLYEGTHNFHNFTSKIKPMDPSAIRYIIEFSCCEPFVRGETEFITLKVKGQSFMLHQIRKMVALAVAVVRNLTPQDTMTTAYQAERLDLPIAPSLGLVLDQVHYDRYNKRYSSDGIHEALEWPEADHEIIKFKDDYIFKYIIETETEEKSMLKWLATLSLHTFGSREEHVNNVSN